MIKIYNKETGEFLGRISEEDLDFLAAQLEEESLSDTDYYLRKETFEGFTALGGSPRLLEVLGGGFRKGEVLEIRWEKDK